MSAASNGSSMIERINSPKYIVTVHELRGFNPSEPDVTQRARMHTMQSHFIKNIYKIWANMKKREIGSLIEG